MLHLLSTLLLPRERDEGTASRDPTTTSRHILITPVLRGRPVRLAMQHYGASYNSCLLNLDMSLTALFTDTSLTLLLRDTLHMNGVAGMDFASPPHQPLLPSCCWRGRHVPVLAAHF